MEESKFGNPGVVVSQHEHLQNHAHALQHHPHLDQDQQSHHVHPELIQVNHHHQQQHMVMSGVTTVIQQLPVIQQHHHQQSIQDAKQQHQQSIQDVKPIEMEEEEMQAIPLEVKPIPGQIYDCEDLSVIAIAESGPLVNEKSANYISIPGENKNLGEKLKKDKEKETNCQGFEESLVLAVKDCFFEEDIRCILIKKTRNGKKVKYFSRSCTNYVDLNRRVCDQCDKWFSNLSGELEFLQENGDYDFDKFDHKGNLSSYLDVKMDDNDNQDSFNGVDHDVGVLDNDNIKNELEDVAMKVKKEVIEDDANGDPDFEPLQDDPNDIDFVAPIKKEKKKKIKKIGMFSSGAGKISNTVKRKIPRECIVEGGFICRNLGCGKVFPKRKGWLKHDRTHDGIKRTCEICGLAVAKLREHIKRVHEEEGGIGRNWERQRKYDEDKTEDDTYLCRFDDCRKLFENKKVYLKHVYLFHEGGNEKRKRKKICEICGANIAANGMKQHIRSVHTHKDERNFTCEHCGKKFKHRTELTSHITHHTGEMNFSCSGCGKKFRRGGEARLCEKGHKGIFKHSCHICDYKTHKKNSLDRHVSSHLKSTPYSCPICGFKSGRKDNLKQHVEKRHATNGTTITQLEAMYPEMYNTSETVDSWRDDSGHEQRVHTPSSPPHRGWHSEQHSEHTVRVVKTEQQRLVLPEQQRVVLTEQQRIKTEENVNRGAQWHPADHSATRVMSPATPPRSTPVPLVMAEQNQERLVLAEHNQERLVLSEQQRALLTEQQRAILSAEQQRAILSTEQQRLVITQQQRSVLTEQQRLAITEQQRALLSEQHRAGLPPR